MGHNDTRLSDLPSEVIERVLDYAYHNEGSAALRYRLVNSAWNEVMMPNVQLQLHYQIKSEEERCAIRLTNSHNWGKSITTDQLIHSSLIHHMVDMRITKDIEGEWDQTDLINLTSKRRRPLVQLHPFKPGSLPQPPAILSQMEVVGISWCQDLNETDLNFTASLTRLGKLNSTGSNSVENLLELGQHIDGTKISEISQIDCGDETQMKDISKLYPNLQTLDIDVCDLKNLSFLRNLPCLKSLGMQGIIDSASLSFPGVKLPNLTCCDIETFDSRVDGNKHLLTSMSAVMPKLNRLEYDLHISDGDEMSNELGQLISVIIQFCPATVKYFRLGIYLDSFQVSERQDLPLTKWQSQMKRVFKAILTSKLAQVRIETPVKPTDCDLATQPFEFKKSRDGEQLGSPLMLKERDGRLKHWYHLKKKDGEICTLEVTYTH